MKHLDWQAVEQVLTVVLELPEEQRHSRVEELCGRNPALRNEVLSLLAAHDSDDSFLGVKTQICSDSNSGFSLAGKQLGPYRLLEPIGRGGMGAVYRAERADGQFKKEVAIKVVLTAMYSPELLRRFASEQQILATLEHPNIARLLDAGVSADGVPYLVMEYVMGTAITDYCHDRRLSFADRLRLFQTVCSTVHYAHQHLIVHRDIKPANILVTAEGVPKLLDFGIAKLLDPWTNVGDRSTQSIFNPMTPDYASPEQVRSEAITTATDVYSLGVILYQLLADQRPYSVAAKSPSEAVRTICEVEPEKPSTVVHNRNKRNHGSLREPGLSSELDAIVGKAMRKDPGQRYGSAQDLGQDVSRYLGGQPVLAHRGSLHYGITKFVGRHKLPAAFILILLMFALSGVSAVVWQAQIALQERDRASAAQRTAMEERDRALRTEATAKVERDRAIAAEGQARHERNRSFAEKQRADTEAATAKAVSDFLREDVLAQAGASTQARPGTRPDPDLKVRTALDRAAARMAGKFEKQPLVEASIRQTIGNTYSDLGLYGDAQQQLERAYGLARKAQGEESLGTLAIMSDLAVLYDKQGKYPQGEQLLLKAIESGRRLLGEKHPAMLSAMNNLGLLYRHEGKNALAEPLYARVVELRRRLLGEEHPDTLISMNNLAVLYRDEGKPEQAESLLRKVLEIKRRVLGEEHPSTLLGMNTLASLYLSQGEYAQAERLFAKVLEVRLRILGDEHADTLHSMDFLARAQWHQGKFAAAEPLLTKAVETQRRILGNDHPDTLRGANSLALLYIQEGKFAQAEPLFTNSSEKFRRALGEEHPDTLIAMSNLGVLYRAEGMYARAQPILVQVLEKRRRLLGPEHPDTLLSIYNLGLSYLQSGNYAEAEPLFTQVLEVRRRLLGSGHPQTKIVAASLGRLRLEEQRYAEAELLLRQALDGQEIRPAGWERYDIQRMLGASLMAQSRFVEAEPLLRSGYRGLVECKDAIPWENRPVVEQASEQIIALYESWGQPAQAATWRHEHPVGLFVAPQRPVLSTNTSERKRLRP